MQADKTPSLPHVIANVRGRGPQQALRVDADRARLLVRSISGSRATLPRKGRTMLLMQPGSRNALVMRVIDGAVMVHDSEADPLYRAAPAPAYEVVPAVVWQRDDGAQASIYGSVP